MMSDEIFLALQVKRSVTIINKHGLYDALQVAKRLKIWDLRKLGNIKKISKLHRIIS